jgi:phosphoribosylanthranilate isomerase
MPRTRIKICGITRPEDAQLAAELGADAIGLNFVGGPRQIGLETADNIEKVLPPIVERIALLSPSTVRAFFDRILEVKDAKKGLEVFGQWMSFLRERITSLQAYDWQKMVEDDHSIFATMSTGYWAVVQVADRSFAREVTEKLAWYADRRWTCPTPLEDDLSSQFYVPGIPFRPPAALVLDTASKTQLGGTGETFNWHWIAEARAAGELTGLPPIILAGGLTPDNVADAIRIAQPYAVDVSSGVEAPNKPGIKDPLKLRDFIQAVHAADQELGATGLDPPERLSP